MIPFDPACSQSMIFNELCIFAFFCPTDAHWEKRRRWKPTAGHTDPCTDVHVSERKKEKQKKKSVWNFSINLCPSVHPPRAPGIQFGKDFLFLSLSSVFLQGLSQQLPRSSEEPLFLITRKWCFLAAVICRQDCNSLIQSSNSSWNNNGQIFCSVSAFLWHVMIIDDRDKEI